MVNPGTGGGASGTGRGGGRKGRFAPTVPSRRKKEDAPAAAISSAEATTQNEAFKDLMLAATSEASWQRGAGRGRGRGQQQQRFQVTFSGNDAEPVLAAAKTRYTSQGGGTGSGKGGSGGGKDGASGSGSRTKSEPGAEEEPLAGPKEVRLKRKDQQSRVLDYNQIYPVTLPLRPPPDLEHQYPGFVEYVDEDASEGEDEAPKLLDLAVAEEVPGNPAVELRLLEGGLMQGDLYQVQLPAVMPVQSVKTQTPQPTKSKAGAVKEEAGSTSGPEAARNVRDMPAGKIGQILVFQSGQVKMRMGDVLLDVSPGTQCQYRQDAVAISLATNQMVVLGQVVQRMVISPDIWQLMEDSPVPDWPHGEYQPPVETVQPAELAGGQQQPINAVQSMETDGHDAHVAGKADIGLVDGGKASINSVVKVEPGLQPPQPTVETSQTGPAASTNGITNGKAALKQDVQLNARKGGVADFGEDGDDEMHVEEQDFENEHAMGDADDAGDDDYS